MSEPSDGTTPKFYIGQHPDAQVEPTVNNPAMNAICLACDRQHVVGTPCWFSLNPNHVNNAPVVAEVRRAPIDLEGIRARAEKATEGPWAHETQQGEYCDYSTGHVVSSNHSYRGNKSPNTRPESVTSPDTLTFSDGEFIAHARKDIPDLLAEVARLTAERDEARGIAAKVNNEVIGSDGYFTEPSCVHAVQDLKLLANRRYADLEALRTRLRGLEQQWREKGPKYGDCESCADELARLLTTPEEPKI